MPRTRHEILQQGLRDVSVPNAQQLDSAAAKQLLLGRTVSVLLSEYGDGEPAEGANDETWIGVVAQLHEHWM